MFPKAVGDQDLLPLAADFNHPTAFFGSASEDRKNQFAVASVLDVPYGMRLGPIANIASPLPQTLFLPASGGVPGEIFRYRHNRRWRLRRPERDRRQCLRRHFAGNQHRIIWTGRKARPAQYRHSKVQLNFGNQLTPAGQALVNAGVLSRVAVAYNSARIRQPYRQPPADNAGLAWLKTFRPDACRAHSKSETGSFSNPASPHSTS